MAMWHCRECTTAYAVGIPACPHCQSTDYSEDPMPKITRHGGPSVAGAVVTGGAWGDDDTAADQPRVELRGEPGPELADLPAGTAVHYAEGGEQSSPGSSSSASPEKQQPKQKPTATSRPKRARTTANPSTPGRTDSSSARTTDGDPTEPDTK